MLALCVLASGCSLEMWRTPVPPLSAEVLHREFGLQRGGLEPEQIKLIAEPEHLRPCCAFGSELRVSLGPIPVPGYEIYNTIGPEDVGDHEYDGGVPLKGKLTFDALKTGENNGLVYTCRAGFIDIAHLRLWADYTMFLTAWIGRHLDTGGTLPIREEGGERRLVLKPVDPELRQDYTVRQLTVPLAMWIAYQMSIWHEIVTWYGWSHLAMFPELASAFSPEDMYSNLLGIKISGSLIYERQVESERKFNEAMTVSIPLLLNLLGGQPGDVGNAAATYVDGVWWDSTAKLPSKALVRKRYFDIGNRIRPWRVTDMDGGAPPEIVEACGESPRHSLSIEPSFAGQKLSERATLEIDVSDALVDAGFPLPRKGDRRVTPADFPRLIEIVREANAEEFGPDADRPQR